MFVYWNTYSNITFRKRKVVIYVLIYCIFDIFLYMSNHTVGRRQWHPTPVLLARKSHGWRTLVGCSPWGRLESDMTERLHFLFLSFSFGAPWLSPWSNKCWHFDLWFLCLFLKHLAGTSRSSWFTYCWSLAWRILSITLLTCEMSTAVSWFDHFGHCLSLGFGEGNGNPLQYSCLENPMDRGVWWATVQGSQRVGRDWATSLSLP